MPTILLTNDDRHDCFVRRLERHIIEALEQEQQEQYAGHPLLYTAGERKGSRLLDVVDPDCESDVFVRVRAAGGLLGGKGGFGSLLRGQRAIIPKHMRTNDACRDLNGRRIRHVKQEKQLSNWDSEAANEKKKRIHQVSQGKVKVYAGPAAAPTESESTTEPVEKKADAAEKFSETVSEAVSLGLKAALAAKKEENAQEKKRKAVDPLPSVEKKKQFKSFGLEDFEEDGEKSADNEEEDEELEEEDE
uniref:SDE2-like domain-containing protein n=1 Tax=Palpitomonas bilix TaxID=652834 RepID=A0A7S3G1M5_9EUKA|mmetsp:Transcript_1118/g.2396  ORF Transcript_1118/g.2396 Transcript_1118/m.2396 type:complete len:247 (+) Transcript_1118:205-945(+)|eukprot:CAMPEP_0113887426 /NCGR_PEP_ID=MMETSP0780_2-20120614/12207_1 /TAXON_ID=652834 /ORGANISM="Palpitomonas bilix" /LENGTH=246 /DNA_ID=CAMNT_0000875957 /DNA_START=144 /DNA_END=884 /DNA_ORIENTATION=+ /assembly_acc=CAM_ASM_000599